jgi:hypothetical protein
MKYFTVFVILIGLAFPVFAQNTTQNSAITRRFSALGDSMNSTISSSTSTLASFDSQITDNSDVRVYTTYLRKYNYLADKLQESEIKVNLMLRSNDRTNYILAERDNYEDLIKQLQSVKSDFDTYLKSR